MAAVVNGTAHLWGVSGSVTNATVLDWTPTDELANRAQTENEQGNVIERRSDDRTTTATITLRIRSGYVIPAAGTNLTYENTVYEITKVGKPQKNKEFRTVTLDVVTSEFVALS